MTLTDRQKRTLLEGYGKIHLLAGDGKDLDGQFPSAKSGPSDEIKDKWKMTQQTHHRATLEQVCCASSINHLRRK